MTYLISCLSRIVLLCLAFRLDISKAYAEPINHILCAELLDRSEQGPEATALRLNAFVSEKKQLPRPYGEKSSLFKKALNYFRERHSEFLFLLTPKTLELLESVPPKPIIPTLAEQAARLNKFVQSQHRLPRAYRDEGQLYGMTWAQLDKNKETFTSLLSKEAKALIEKQYRSRSLSLAEFAEVINNFVTEHQRLPAQSKSESDDEWQLACRLAVVQRKRGFLQYTSVETRKRIMELRPESVADAVNEFVLENARKPRLNAQNPVEALLSLKINRNRRKPAFIKRLSADARKALGL